jgi:prepilin-type N-terminal cleavage/methylation domain-containing protein
MKKAFTLIELLIAIVIVVIFCALMVPIFGGGNVSDGARVGCVGKFANKGVMVKSWEGELIMGGTKGSSDGDGGLSLVANVWEFTVMDNGIAEQINMLLDTGHRAKFFYHQSFFYNPFVRDTAYTVWKVEDLQPTNSLRHGF